MAEAPSLRTMFMSHKLCAWFRMAWLNRQLAALSDHSVVPIATCAASQAGYASHLPSPLPPLPQQPLRRAAAGSGCRRARARDGATVLKNQRAPKPKSNLRRETIHWWMQSCRKVCVLRCKHWQCSQCHVGSQRAAVQPKQARVQVRHCFRFFQQRGDLHSPVAQAATSCAAAAMVCVEVA